MNTLSHPTMKASEYTHKWLIANGFTRENPDQYRGIGFIRYVKGSSFGFGYTEEVVFCGNNATMEKHAEGVWKLFFPKVYAWWTKPDRTSVLPDNKHGGKRVLGNRYNIFIKGEDPMVLAE